jgi:hypothetical protein
MGGIKMSTKLEMIEMLRERAHVTYEEAKEALDKCNDDVVEALVYLERNHKAKVEPEKRHKNGYAFIRWIKGIIRKGNRTKLAITKNEKSTLRIPLTLLILVTIIAPHLTVIAFIIALFTEHRFEIIKENGENVEIKKAFEEAVSSVNNVGKEVVVQEKESEDSIAKS